VLARDAADVVGRHRRELLRQARQLVRREGLDLGRHEVGRAPGRALEAEHERAEQVVLRQLELVPRDLLRLNGADLVQESGERGGHVLG